MWSVRNGIDGPFAILSVALGNRVPVELQRPVEAAHVGEIGLGVVVLERVVVDYIDHRTHHCRAVALDPVQQRLDPT
jgi:hypothetical protein